MLYYLTGNTRVHRTHHVVEWFFFHTGRAQIGTPTANGLFRFSVRTSELAGRTYINTAATQATDFRFDVKGCTDTALFAPSAETDGFSHHLFLTHPDAKPTEDAVLKLLFKTLLTHVVF